MAVIDVDSFLAPFGDSPAGGNLEYDATFLELDTASRGKPEQQFGDTKVEAEEPDWREVNNLATELMGRTKDLRVAILYLRAQTQLNGLAGTAAGLALIHGYLDQYWESIHPLLDPDDDNDPTTRLNTLAAMCDTFGLMRDLRKVPLTRSRQLGRISFTDYLVATGAIENTEGAQPVDIRLVDGAFADTDQGELADESASLESALSHLSGINSTLGRILGLGFNLDLKPIRKLLTDIKKLVDTKVGAGPGGGEVYVEEAASAPSGGGMAWVSGGAAPVAGPPGQIRSRADVLAAIDKICQYYQQNEPSHPLPLLMDRAKRIVSMDFVALLRDLAPDGMQSFRNIAGLTDDY